MPDYPSYLNAYQSGKLKKIADELFLSLAACQICPRRCKANRLKKELGFCKTAELPEVFSFMAHHGEEPPISGTAGSGTIFFSHCNMGCAYCQNYEFSQLGQGRKYTFSELAQVMLKLQDQGCHNINLVTPTHVLPQILKSLELAIAGGLKIPLVYNTSGYELAGVIKSLAGIVDIYLADIRYGDNLVAKKLSKVDNYVKHNQEALIEMHRQVAVAEFSEDGLIKKGLIIRHLVLPNQASQTESVMKFIARELSEDTYVSLMSQYLPYHLASGYPEINRRLKEEEYRQAKEILERYSLFNGWIQESYGAERFAGVNIKPHNPEDNCLPSL
jgi:putative pyruvate formate lyase activating enzyme